MSDSALGACRQTRHAAAVEHQQGSTDSVERSIPNESCDDIRVCDGGMSPTDRNSKLVDTATVLAVP